MSADLPADADLLVRLSTRPYCRLMLMQLTAPLIDNPAFLCQMDIVSLSRVVALSRGLPIVAESGAPLSTPALNLAVGASCTYGSQSLKECEQWIPAWRRTRFATDEELTETQHRSRQIITTTDS